MNNFYNLLCKYINFISRDNDCYLTQKGENFKRSDILYNIRIGTIIINNSSYKELLKIKTLMKQGQYFLFLELMLNEPKFNFQLIYDNE
jgi:hypothetical protein